MTFAHVYNKIQNEDNTRKHKIIHNQKSDWTIKIHLLNSYFIIGNSKSWQRVLIRMAPGGLGFTVYKWLRQWAWLLVYRDIVIWS